MGIWGTASVKGTNQVAHQGKMVKVVGAVKWLSLMNQVEVAMMGKVTGSMADIREPRRDDFGCRAKQVSAPR